MCVLHPVSTWQVRFLFDPRTEPSNPWNRRLCLDAQHKCSTLLETKALTSAHSLTRHGTWSRRSCPQRQPCIMKCTHPKPALRELLSFFALENVMCLSHGLKRTASCVQYTPDLLKERSHRWIAFSDALSEFVPPAPEIFCGSHRFIV